MSNENQKKKRKVEKENPLQKKLHLKSELLLQNHPNIKIFLSEINLQMKTQRGIVFFFLG